jgi:hypothetical protein
MMNTVTYTGGTSLLHKFNSRGATMHSDHKKHILGKGNDDRERKIHTLSKLIRKLGVRKVLGKLSNDTLESLVDELSAHG